MQKRRWSEDEFKLIQDVFKDEEFVYAVRDVMMGFKETFEHKTNDNILGILKKNLLPTYQIDVPLEMQQDLCQISLNHIAGFNAEQGILRIQAFDIGKDYLERRFKVLQGEEDKGESLADLRDKIDVSVSLNDRFVRMLAYLMIGEYVEKSLNQLVMMANYQEPTPEELRARELKNSSR